jgi:hypothetical protein
VTDVKKFWQALAYNPDKEKLAAAYFFELSPNKYLGKKN